MSKVKVEFEFTEGNPTPNNINIAFGRIGRDYAFYGKTKGTSEEYEYPKFKWKLEVSE